MQSMKKRALSVLLALMMVIGMVPVTVSAATTADVEVKITTDTIAHSDMPAALTAAFGTSSYGLSSINRVQYDYRYAVNGTGDWYTFDSAGTLSAGDAVYLLQRQSRSVQTGYDDVGTFVITKTDAKVVLRPGPVKISIKEKNGISIPFVSDLDLTDIEKKLFTAMVDTSVSDPDVNWENVTFYGLMESANNQDYVINSNFASGFYGKNLSTNNYEPIRIVYGTSSYGPVTVYFVADAATVVYEDGLNGAAFATQSYEVGAGSSTPAFVGIPEREGHIFMGWDSNGDGEAENIPSTTTAGENTTITYTALWTKLCTAEWFVNGELKETDEGLLAGEIPVFNGTTQWQNETTVYTITGWTPAVGPIYNDVEYKAAISETPRPYTVQWVNVDGKVLETASGTYDGSHSYPDSTDGLTYQDGGKQYTFKEWSEPVVDDATSTITYTAIYTESDITYTVDFKEVDSENVEGVEDQTVNYGGEVTLPNPTKEGYTFLGWSDGTTTHDAGATITVTENMTLTATWKVNEYTITFNTEGGSEIAAITQAYGTAVTAPAAPTKTGYTFDGWDTEVPATMPAEDMTIKATWKVNEYTITFDTDGGSEIAPITQEYGTAVTAPAAPTKTGYTFDGWNTAIPTTMPATDMTITAKWKVNQYTITFDTAGGTAINPIKQDYGTAVTAPAAPTKEGYTFASWSPAIPATMPATDMTVTAQWTINQYKVVFNAGDGAFADGSKTKEIMVNYGEKPMAPETPTRAGYGFGGWTPTLSAVGVNGATYTATYVAGAVNYTIETYTMDTKGNYGDPVTETKSNDTDTVITLNPEEKIGFTVDTDASVLSGTIHADGSLVLKVYYARNQYTLTTNVDGVETTKNYYYEEAVTAPEAPTKTGYTFKGWDKAIPTTMPAENVTITATWAAAGDTLYTVETYTMDTEGNYGAPVTETEYGTTGTVIKLTPEKEGFTVDKEKSVLEGTIAANGSLVLKVYYTRNQYDFTTVVDGEETATTYYYEEAVTAPADPTKEGYTFTGWDKVIPTTMPAENVTITAQWTVNQYTITFDTDGGSDVAPITQDYGATITAPAAPTKTGYTFTGWDTEIPTTMPAENVTIKATWKVNEYTITFNTDGGSEIAPITQEYGMAVTAPAAPTKEGYTFTGWDKVIPSTMPAEDMTITATWIPDVNKNGKDDTEEDFTVTVAAYENGSVSISFSDASVLEAETNNGTTRYIFNSSAVNKVSVTATYTANDGYYSEKTTETVDASNDNGITFSVEFKPITIEAESNETAVTSDAITKAENTEALIQTVKEATRMRIEPENYAGGVKTMYLARPADTTLTIDLPQTIELGGMVLDKAGIETLLAATNINISFPYEISLPESWLEIGTPIRDVSPEDALKNVMNGVLGDTVAKSEEAIKAALLKELAHYGCHTFGTNTTEDRKYSEQVQYVYKDGEVAVTSDVVIFTIEEVRAETKILLKADYADGNITVAYGTCTNEKLIDKLVDGVVYLKDGREITLENAVVTIDGSVHANSLNASETAYEMKLIYAGDEDYTESYVTIYVTVEPAEASVYVNSQTVRYGDPVANPIVISPDGVNTIDILAGIDGNDKNHAIGMVQVALPDDMAELLYKANELAGWGYDLSNLTVEDVEVLMAKASEYGAEDIASIWTENKADIDKLLAVLEKLQATMAPYVETELRISIAAELMIPEDIGVYMIATILSDDNYKAVDSGNGEYKAGMDVGYLIITPDGEKTQLTWNETDENGILTLSKLDINFGASTGVNAADACIEYLFIGVDNDGELLLNRVHNGEDVNEVLTQVGVYAQVAYVADWGNTMYYADPIARPVVVSPDVANVTIHDENGKENYAQVYTYGEPISISIRVDGVENAEGLKIKYIGADTTADGYYRDTVPTDAGVYTIVAIYTKTDGEEDLSKAGAAVGVLIIEPADAVVEMKDTYCAAEGAEHFANLTNEELDYVTVAIDRESNTAYVNLPEDAASHMDRLITMLPAEMEAKVVALFEKYADFDGDVSTETIKSELNAIMDEAIEKNMTAEAKAAAQAVIEKLTEEIENSGDLQTLAAKIKAGAQSLEDKIASKLPEEFAAYEQQIKEYISRIVSEEGFDAEKVKADLYEKIDEIKAELEAEGGISSAAAGALYTIADEIVEVLKDHPAVDEAAAEVRNVIEELERLQQADTREIVTAMLEAIAGKIDKDQLKTLLKEVLAKTEELGYDAYVKDLLSAMAEMYPVNVNSYVEAVQEKLDALVAQVKAKVESGELTEADLDNIEGYVDATLIELQKLIDKIPDGTVVFGSNPTEAGIYDCYAMNISANYKPEFVSATLVIGHEYPDTWTDCEDDKQHKKVCIHDATHVIYADHVDAAPHDGVCDDCGAQLGFTVSVTAISWDQTDNAIALLYSADLDDAAIRADVISETPELALAYTAAKGDITANADGKRFDQTFTFEALPEGTYKLAIFKKGKYVPQVVQITVSEDGGLGSVKLWLYGDVDYDGKLRAMDAGHIGNYINYIGSAFDLSDEVGDLSDDTADRLLAADVNCDGFIRAMDAGHIGNYINYIGSAFDYLR